MNDEGVIVGDYIFQSSAQNPPVNYGFLLRDEKYTAIFIAGSDQGGLGTQVNGISNFNAVVGVFSDATGYFHGLLWTNGTAYELDYPSAVYNEAHTINDLGVITGSYSTDPTGTLIHGYVAYPRGW